MVFKFIKLIRFRINNRNYYVGKRSKEKPLFNYGNRDIKLISLTKQSTPFEIRDTIVYLCKKSKLSIFLMIIMIISSFSSLIGAIIFLNIGLNILNVRWNNVYFIAIYIFFTTKIVYGFHSKFTQNKISNNEYKTVFICLETNEISIAKVKATYELLETSINNMDEKSNTIRVTIILAVITSIIGIMPDLLGFFTTSEAFISDFRELVGLFFIYSSVMFAFLAPILYMLTNSINYVKNFKKANYIRVRLLLKIYITEKAI